MKKFSNAILILAVVALAALPLMTGTGETVANAQAQTAKVNYAAIASGDYRIDPLHTTIGFAIRHYEINWVNGSFKDFSGTVHYDGSDVTKSSVDFTAKIDSIDTGVTPRNNHLKSPDFFDAAKFPEMSFTSTRVERKGKGGYVLHGNFTLKGVTKEIEFPFTITGAITDQQGNTRLGIEAQTKIDRRDYGITWGHALSIGGLDVGNEVTIKLNLEVVKAGEKPASK